MPTSSQNGVELACSMHLVLLGGFYGDFEIWFFNVPFPPLKWPNRLGCKKKYLHGKEQSKSENKNSSENCVQNYATWEHAKFEKSKFSQ